MKLDCVPPEGFIAKCLEAKSGSALTQHLARFVYAVARQESCSFSTWQADSHCLFNIESVAPRFCAPEPSTVRRGLSTYRLRRL